MPPAPRNGDLYRLTERIGPYNNVSLPYEELERALAAGVHRQRHVDPAWRRLARKFAEGREPVRALVIGGSTMRGFNANTGHPNGPVVFSEQLEQLLRRRAHAIGSNVAHTVDRHKFYGCGVDCYLSIYAELARNGTLARRYDLVVLDHALNDRVGGELTMAHSAESWVRMMRELAPTVALAFVGMHCGTKHAADTAGERRVVQADSQRTPCLPDRPAAPHECERDYLPWLHQAILGDNYVLACYDVPRVNLVEAYATFPTESHGYALLADLPHTQPTFCMDAIHTGFAGHVLAAQMLFELVLQQFESSSAADAPADGRCAPPVEPLLTADADFATRDRLLDGDVLKALGDATNSSCWFWCGTTAASSVPPLSDDEFTRTCRQPSWRHNRTCADADDQPLRLTFPRDVLLPNGELDGYVRVHMQELAVGVEYMRSYENFGDFSVLCTVPKRLEARQTNISGSWARHEWASQSQGQRAVHGRWTPDGPLMIDNADFEDRDVARGGTEVAANHVSVRQRTWVWWTHTVWPITCEVRALPRNPKALEPVQGGKGNEVAVLGVRIGVRVLKSSREAFLHNAMNM